MAGVSASTDLSVKPPPPPPPPTIESELEKLRRADPNGELRPEAVVEFAENHPRSVLGRLLPSPGHCVHFYRLHWARNIILRVRVKIIEAPTAPPLRAYVSLSDHRGEEGGYMPMKVVLASKGKRHRLILDTLVRLESITEVQALPELAEVAKALARTRARYPRD